MWQRDFQKALAEAFASSQDTNERFTLRSFAQKAQVSPGGMSEILSGKRNVSLRKAVQVLTNVGADPEKIESIKQMAKELNTNTRYLLPEEAHRLVARWYYFAILSVYDTSNPPQSLAELAQRLGLSLDVVQKATKDLVHFELLSESLPEIFVTTKKAWRTTDGVASRSIFESHQDGLEISKKALSALPVEKRDFISLTFCASLENLESARKEVRRFKDRLAKIMGKSSKMDSVFRLGVQLYPLDQWPEQDQKIISDTE